MVPVHHPEKKQQGPGRFSSRDVLEGRFEVKGNKKQCGVGFGNVLDGLDHGVETIQASNTLLKRASTLAYQFFLGSHNRLEGKSAEK